VNAERPPSPGQPGPLADWTDHRVATWGRAICQQRALPTHPAVAAEQAGVLQEWARHWGQRGPTDLFGQVELGLIEELAGQLRRLAGRGHTDRMREATVSAERPTQVPGFGVVLSPAETDRLRAVLGAAGHTLAAEDEQLPVGQRLAQRMLAVRLEQAATDLTRRMLRAEQASVRLDVPVPLDAGERARVLGLLELAAARLEEAAARRASQPYLIGPDYFRGQASAARAWHADLAELAARQADRCQPERETKGARTPGQEAGHER
jgi:hypothetical protein